MVRTLTRLASAMMLGLLGAAALLGQDQPTPGRKQDTTEQQGITGKNVQNTPLAIFYWHYNIGYANDFQNGGLTTNMDNRFTYGLHSLFALNNWEFFFGYRALTDRYTSKTRTDELEIGLSYIWGNLLSRKFWASRPQNYNRRAAASYSATSPLYLQLGFDLGYFQAGNLHGQDIQNFFHSLSKVPQVAASYLPGKATLRLGLRAYFSYTAAWHRLLPSWEDSLWQWGILAEGALALGYQERLRLGLRSKLYSGNQYWQFDFYLQQLGYLPGFGRAGTVEALWSQTSTAFWLAFSSRTGLYQRRVEMNLGSLSSASQDSHYSFAFGSLELSWNSLQQKKSFAGADYSQSLLLGINSGLVEDRFAFPFLLAGRIPSDISFVAVRSLAGEPRLFAGNPLARKTESFWLAMMYLRPTLDLKKWGFVEFYAGLGLGVLALEAVRSLEKFGGRNAYQYFTIGGQTGLRWYGLPLRPDGTVYGIEVAILGLFPFTGQASNVRLPGSGILLDHLRPQLSLLVGLCILADL